MRGWKNSGDGSTTGRHKADNTEPRRTHLKSIEDVLEHTLAGVSKND